MRNGQGDDAEQEVMAYTEEDMLAQREAAIDNWRESNNIPQSNHFEVEQVDGMFSYVLEPRLDLFVDLRDHLVAHCRALDECVLCSDDQISFKTKCRDILVQELTSYATCLPHCYVHGLDATKCSPHCQTWIVTCATTLVIGGNVHKA